MDIIPRKAKMTVLTNYCLLLVILAVFRETRSLSDLKICTTVDCPNEHIEVADGIDGVIHRYSNNAANFQEAKASPSPAKVGQHGGHASQPSPKTVLAAQRQHLSSADGHTVDQQAHVSVLGDGGRMGQRLQKQHPQLVQEPPMQRPPSNNHLQQQRNHHQQQQQQQRQLNPDPLQYSTTKEVLSQIPTSGAKQDQRNVTRRVRAVEDGIYWSATVESAIPPGDLYCYYLARMLGLKNVPTVVFSHVSNDTSSQWSSVAADINNAGWENNTVASFSLWIDDLGKSHLPEIMYNNQRETIYPTTPGFADLNITELVELAQYSDLIVFDYITVHLDRMTIRKNAVEYYQQDWLYEGEVHNLAKHKTNGGLWFIDNENGIFNSYAVAYSHANKNQMQGYHEELLRSFCVFRRSTFDKVHELARLEDPFDVLDSIVHYSEPVVDVAIEHNKYLFLNVSERFKKRLANVAQWMDSCQSRSSG